VEKANAFVGSQPRDSFIPFGTVHVDLSINENLDSLARHGIRAVKIHPIFQDVALDDRRLWALFDAFASDIVCIVHVGGDGNADARGRCTPPMLATVVHNFPRLKLIACHFGGYEHLADAEEYVIGRPVAVDCSWPPTLAAIPPEVLRAVISRHGVDNVCWGSDWPMADQATELDVIRGLGLGDDAEAAICGGNIARLLDLDER
jgi:predicted TIM-barrel fold metal-dependent hydrolase